MQTGVLEPSLYVVKGMGILDFDGERIIAKYYDKNVLPTVKEQRQFEEKLSKKTDKMDRDDILMMDGVVICYKVIVDLLFYVVGGPDENELMIYNVMRCLSESVGLILRKNYERTMLMKNINTVMLAMDEICDGGIILESDSSQVVSRVVQRTDELPLGEQTVAQVLQSAKEQIKWSLLK